MTSIVTPSTAQFGGYQRQIDAERAVKRRDILFQRDLNELDERRNDEYENYGLQIFQPSRHQKFHIYRISNGSRKQHEQRSHARDIPTAVLSRLETPRNGQMPRNFINT